jgi:hypothetical protein
VPLPKPDGPRVLSRNAVFRHKDIIGVRGILTIGEELMAVPEWIRRFFRSKSARRSANGWTDDCSLELQAGCNVEDLVNHVLVANKEGRQHEVVVAELGEQFGLSVEDAELAMDRVCGGVVRALSGNRANCPDRMKDPIAWASFQRAMAKH